MENSPGGVQRDCLTRTFVLWRWLFACALTTTLAFADGMIIGYDPHLGRWSLQQEESQLCLINYEHGVEKMLVSVALSDLRGPKAAWIIPIPSSPDSTSIDIVKGFPTLDGTNVLAHAERVLARQSRRMSIMHFYPALCLRDPDSNTWFREVNGLYGDESEEVNVHAREEKMGLTTELVTARHPGAIFGYLTEKGVVLPEETRPVLGLYPADSFSFAVTWISDTSAFVRESLNGHEPQDLTPALGISATFPTRRAYFPLRPTSVYGYTRVPIDVYAIGHAAPEFRRHFSPYSAQWVEYMTDADYEVPEALSTFFNGRKYIKQLDYTHITLDAESWTLGWDLWFKPGPSLDVALARLLNDCQLVWVPLIYLLCSCLASIIAAAVVLRRFRLPLIRQAGFGLWNSLTLLGFTVAAVLTRFRNPHSLDVAPEKGHARSAGIGRKLLFIIFFTAIFQALLAAFYLALKTIIRSD